MRCFVPATDDEIFALIERHGFQALVAYRCGMGIGVHGADSAPALAPAQMDWRMRSDSALNAPRQAA